MVLQRDIEVKIWGSADANETLTVEFNGQRRSACADRDGRWHVIFDTLKPGGPYEMQIHGGDSRIVLKDTLVGDVWLLYRSMTVEANRILLSFTHTGGELTAAGDGTLRHFAIAGADGKFVWANAVIENDRVAVWADAVKEPKAVRYAWADNPEGANLYNKEGLPASPFRTDN